MGKLLTREQEHDLGVRVQAGLRAEERLDAGEYAPEEEAALRRAVTDAQAAREVFLEHNMALVVSIVRSYYRPGASSVYDFDDMLQVGVTGLLRAVDKFNPDQGTKFSTPATWWIRQAVGRFRSYYSNTVRLPENRISQHMHMRQLRELNKDLSEEQVRQLIKEELGMTDEEIDVISHAAMPTASLDLPVAPDDTGSHQRTLMDVVDEREKLKPTVETKALAGMLSDELYAAFEKLPPRDADILTANFELFHDTDRALTEREVRHKHRMTIKAFREEVPRATEALRRVLAERHHHRLDDFAEMLAT